MILPIKMLMLRRRKKSPSLELKNEINGLMISSNGTDTGKSDGSYKKS